MTRITNIRNENTDTTTGLTDNLEKWMNCLRDTNLPKLALKETDN